MTPFIESPAGGKWRADSGRVRVYGAAVWSGGRGGLAAKRDAIPLKSELILRRLEGDLVVQLVTDATGVDEVEDSVAAADHGLAIATEIIGKTETRSEVVVVLVNDRVGHTILARQLHGAGVYIER